MIILLGKHQFTVSSIDDGGSRRSSSSSSSIDPSDDERRRDAKDSDKDLEADVIQSLVENTEKIISEIKEGQGHLKDTTVGGSAHDSASSSSSSGKDSSCSDSNEGVSKDGFLVKSSSGGMREKGGRDNTKHLTAKLRSLTVQLTSHLGNVIGSIQDDDGNVDDDRGENIEESIEERASSLSRGNRGQVQQSSSRCCTLTCCAPDGSPLQGKAFVVGSEGAGLGRKDCAANSIKLFARVR